MYPKTLCSDKMKLPVVIISIKLVQIFQTVPKHFVVNIRICLLDLYEKM